MRTKRRSHKIVVNEVEYRWRANLNDEAWSIGIVIWPANGIGSLISGSFHEALAQSREGHFHGIVITNRIIRRVIEHAITHHGYEPLVRNTELNLKKLDDVIRWSDAVRGMHY